MAKAPRLPKKPLTEEAKKAEERKKKREAKKRREAREKAERHKMAEPAKKQPTGRGRPPKKKPKVANLRRSFTEADRAERERIAQANKHNAKLESKAKVQSRIRQGSKAQQKAEMGRVKLDQRIINENWLTPDERRRRAKIAERVAQEKKDFPNKRRAVVKGKLRARAALRGAGTIKTNSTDPTKKYKDSNRNRVKPNPKTVVIDRSDTSLKTKLKNLGKRLKGLTIKGVTGIASVPAAFAASTNRDTTDFTLSSSAEKKARREAGSKKVLKGLSNGLEKYKFDKKPDPKPKPKTDPKPASKKVSANEIKTEPKPKSDPKPTNSKYKKSKFGAGNKKTVEHKGKKLANVTREQLKASGLSLRQYMNKWNKTGKRP